MARETYQVGQAVSAMTDPGAEARDAADASRVQEPAPPPPQSPAPASEADALREEPESGRLLAEHMMDARYQPVILFGNAASGKTSLILSLLATIKTDASLATGLFLGEPILDTGRKYGAFLWEQASLFFGLKTQQFIEGTAAARTNIELPFFVPLILRPSGKPEVRIAFMESNGEWYRAERGGNRFFPPLRAQIEDFIRNYGGGILFIHLLPYTQRRLYQGAAGEGGGGGGSESRELEEAALAVSGALQAYDAVRPDKSRDRHLLLVTKWDAHRGEDGDALDALHDDPAAVERFVRERYAQPRNIFGGLGLREDQKALNGYCAGQISGNDVIRASLDDERGELIRRYPVGLWRWLYRGTLEVAGQVPVDPFPVPKSGLFAWAGRLLDRLF